MLVLLGPLPHHAHVDADHGGEERAVLADHHRLLDVGGELEPVLDELGRELGAVGQLHHVLDAVDDHQVAVVGQVAGVAGVEPAVRARSSAVASSFL